MKRVFALTWFLYVVLCGAAYAQYDGTIRGLVTDPAGAVISGAQVTAVNPTNGDRRSTTTDADGEYVFTAVPAGTYEIHVKQGSFKEFVARGVELHVSSTVVADAQMQVGSASETVTVEANPLQVQTDSAALGTVIEGQQVTELPLNGRSFKQLALIAPGVSAMDGLDVSDKGLLAGSDISVNGNPVTNNLWLVDGVNDNDLGSNRTLLIYPNVDSIAEFNFIRDSYGPEYGQASGGIVSIITKGGTNQFHGTAFYGGRNDALDAATFFGPKPPLRRNDYGFTFGGPVKKDKLFFFYSQEWNKEKLGSVRGGYCMPTPAELSGDFTAAWSEWNSAPPSTTVAPYDQCNATLPAVPGSRGTSPGVGAGTVGGIPLLKVPTPLDQAGVLMEDQLPQANILTGGGVSLVPNSGNNWLEAVNTSLNWRQENARVDFNLNRKNTLTFRYTQENWENPSPNDQAYWGDDPFPAVEGSWSQPSKSIMLKDTTVLSSTLTNQAQLSYSNNRIYASLGGTGITSDALGNSYTPSEFVKALEAAIPPAFPEPKKAGGMPPDAAWGGFGNYGGGQTIWLIAPWNNTSDLYNFRDDLAKVRGQHTLKAGIFIGYNKKHEPAEGGHDEPSFVFNGGNCTPPSCPTATVGNSGNVLMDLLTQGSMYQFSENSANLFPTAIWHQYEFYVQDNWKVRRNLTVEYGFRWSFLREPFEQHNRISSWSLAHWSPALAAANPGDACNGLIIVPGTTPCADANSRYGTSFSPGTAGVNGALVPNNNHLIAPRLGISWDPWGDGRTAIRAGVGQFFQQERVSRVTNLMGQNAPFSLAFSSNRTLDQAVSAVGGSASPSYATSPDSTVPNSWQWNFTVERQVYRDTTLELGYVGNRGIHLTSDRDSNGILPGAQTRILEAFQGTAICSYIGPSCEGAVTRPAYNFGGIDEFGHAGSSSYHALQALFTSRLSNRSLFQAAYTWSHTIANIDESTSAGSGFGTHSQTDAYDINVDRGNTAINRPQIFTLNWIYYLPSFSGSRAVQQQAIGGWQFGGIFQAISGNSFTNYYNAQLTDLNQCVAPDGTTIPGCSVSSNNIQDDYGTGNGSNNINTQRFMGTDVSCNASLNGSQNATFFPSGRGSHPGPQIINPAAFTLVGYQIGTVGSGARGACLGPKQVNLDLSMYKTWKLTERFSLQFRFDAFDAFNHPQFTQGGVSTGGPTGVECGTTACSPTNNTVTNVVGSYSSNFGQASTQRSGGAGNRQLQYGLKLIF